MCHLLWLLFQNVQEFCNPTDILASAFISTANDIFLSFTMVTIPNVQEFCPRILQSKCWTTKDFPAFYDY